MQPEETKLLQMYSGFYVSYLSGEATRMFEQRERDCVINEYHCQVTKITS